MPIPDRRALFTGLYTKTNLEAARFPYLLQVQKVLDTKEYREAVLPYAY